MDILTTPNKTVIDTIKSCNSFLNRVWRGKCSTGWNVNSVQFNGGFFSKDEVTGDWSRTEKTSGVKTNLGQGNVRDVWSVYLKDYQIDIHTMKIAGPNLANITQCSHKGRTGTGVKDVAIVDNSELE